MERDNPVVAWIVREGKTVATLAREYGISLREMFLLLDAETYRLPKRVVEKMRADGYPGDPEKDYEEWKLRWAREKIAKARRSAGLPT